MRIKAAAPLDGTAIRGSPPRPLRRRVRPSVTLRRRRPALAVAEQCCSGGFRYPSALPRNSTANSCQQYQCVML